MGRLEKYKDRDSKSTILKGGKPEEKKTVPVKKSKVEALKKKKLEKKDATGNILIGILGLANAGVWIGVFIKIFS